MTSSPPNKVIHPIGGILRLDMPLVQAQHPVHLRREPFVVRRDKRRRAMVAHQPHELVEHAVGGRFVEIARRLVGEHEQGAVRKRARDRDALLLAARQLARLVMQSLAQRSEEHTSELQSLMRISYAVFCLKKKKQKQQT